MKSIYKKSNTLLIFERLNTIIYPKIGYKTNMSTFVTLIEHIAEVLASALKQEKEHRSEKKKYSLFADNMNVYIKISKKSTKR